MEAETVFMLTVGFKIITGLSLIVILRFLYKYKDKAFFGFVAQLMFLTLGFYKFIGLIQQKPKISEVMLSEENSLAIGVIGIMWALSMLSMIAGICFLKLEGKSKDNTNN